MASQVRVGVPRCEGLLCYRAGERALARLRERGFGPGQVRVLLAPAVGPKWLAVAGMDQALMAGGYLAGPARVTVVGASAGAWRAFAHLSRDPDATHHRLRHDYIDQRFTRADDPQTISHAYRRLLGRVFDDGDVHHALAHPHLSLAIVAARARGLTGVDRRGVQLAALATAAVANAVSARTRRLFFERTLFSPAHVHDPVLDGLRGRRTTLTADNARAALLASGSVPLVMAAQRNLTGAAPGQYLDGGLTDYHVAQPIDCGDRGVAVLLLHQRRIVPSWFDKHLPHRRPRRDWLRDVLLIHPSRAWVEGLPGGRVPTREDFETFVARPEERIRRWQETTRRSEALGEQLLADAQAGRIPDLLQPL